MTPQRQTLPYYCERDGIPLRKAQRHVKNLKTIGTRFGRTYALTENEWKRVKSSIAAARPGNPNWGRKT